LFEKDILKALHFKNQSYVLKIVNIEPTKNVEFKLKTGAVARKVYHW